MRYRLLRNMRLMSIKLKLQWNLGILSYMLATLFLVYEMALQVSPSIMTHSLMYAFKINARQLGFMASIYFYSYTSMQIPVGLLYDRYGPRKLISSTAAVCGLGSCIFALTTNVYLAGFSRFFMGIGSAFAFVGVLVIATRWFTPYYFAFLVGIAQLLAALGALGGELPLAPLINHFGWRYVMGGGGILGLLIALFCFLIIRDRPSEGYCVGKRSHHLIRDIREIFHSSQTWWIALYAFSAWGPVTVFAALWGVPFLMRKYAVSNTLGALAVAMIWIGLGVSSPLLGWLSDRIRRRRLLLRLCSFLGLISSLIVIYFNCSFWLSCVFLFILGIAAAGQILTFALVKDNNRQAIVATSLSFNNMAVVVGGAIFQPFVGYILDFYWNGEMHEKVPIYSLSNYHVGLIVVPACFLLGLIVSLFFIRETYCLSRYDDYSNYVK